LPGTGDREKDAEIVPVHRLYYKKRTTKAQDLILLCIL
jgi:hypothetical protein